MKLKINRVVYRLWHEGSAKGRVGYIGKDTRYPSRVNLSKRASHTGCPKLYQALKKHSINIWHKEVLSSGFRTDLALSKAEVFWIKKFDSKNKGYNCTDGGEGVPGWVPSIKTLRKMSQSHKGKKASIEHRENIRKALKGRVIPVSVRKKISISVKKLSLSPEYRNMLSLAHKGIRPSLEARKKMSLARKGMKFSKEHRRRMGESQIGEKNHQWGKKRSVEHRKKISEANKLSWAKRKAIQAKLNGREEGTNAG